MAGRIRGIHLCEETQVSDDRNHRWYLDLMMPNTKGEGFAWLYPPSLYADPAAFRQLLDDLAEPFLAERIDLVAGLDATGFILGAGLAARLNAGFLAIRKAGTVAAESETISFTNYTGRTGEMEVHKPALAPGARVVLVDQWIETGGTMRSSIALIERLGGVVAGVATICIEETKATEAMRRDYKCATAVVPGTSYQRQCNAHHLDSFDPGENRATNR